MNIINILQREVNNIVSESYKDDSCPPVFLLFLYYKNIVL